MTTMVRILHAISGRWDERHPPTTAELAVAAVALGVMLLAVVLGWAGGEAFVYEGF